MKTKFRAIDDEIASFRAERVHRKPLMNEFVLCPSISTKEIQESKNMPEIESAFSTYADNSNSELGRVPLLLDLAMNALLEYETRIKGKCRETKTSIENDALLEQSFEQTADVVTCSGGNDNSAFCGFTVPCLLQLAFDVFAASKTKI